MESNYEKMFWFVIIDKFKEKYFLWVLEVCKEYEFEIEWIFVNDLKN